MAKRFTDTEKWKKPFIRGLQGAYKLLWFYILDDCDHAGIWQVDFEVARIRTGEQIDKQAAISAFGDRVEIFADGSKWFLRDFIEFQYGQLNEKNRMHLSVINILTKNKVGPYKGLTSPQGKGQGNGSIKGQGEIQGPGDELDDNFINWTKLIFEGNDQDFEQMLMNENFKLTAENFDFLCRDHLDLLSRYPKMQPNSQHKFRNSLMKHMRENHLKLAINGNGTNKKQQSNHSTATYLADYYSKKFSKQ